MFAVFNYPLSAFFFFFFCFWTSSGLSKNSVIDWGKSVGWYSKPQNLQFKRKSKLTRDLPALMASSVLGYKSLEGVSQNSNPTSSIWLPVFMCFLICFASQDLKYSLRYMSTKLFNYSIVFINCLLIDASSEVSSKQTDLFLPCEYPKYVCAMLC